MKDDEQQGEEGLIAQAFGGDEAALATLLQRYRTRLEVFVQLRIDPRARTRFEVADVIQEAFLRASRELPRFRETRHLPMYLWLRSVTSQALWRLHRHHLGAEMRDAGRVVSIDGGPRLQATSAALAARLVGTWTSPSHHAMRVEARTILIEALEAMEPLDREILTLRHLEDLSHREAAIELGIDEGAARKRHIRAIGRLRRVLDSYPDLLSG